MDILIINPWIFDFAAFDMWARPLGLLQIAACLRNHGYSVSFLDCLDTSHPMVQESAKRPKAKAFGTSKYYKEEIEKPLQYAHIPRRYSRYGLPPHIVKELLLSLPKPKAILVGSMMTYWYLGVQSTISLVREVFEGVPIILGGIYVRLCSEHAERFSGADYVIAGDSFSQLLGLLKSLNITGTEKRDFHPYPAYDLLKRRDVVGLMTTRGCPFCCSYCASPYLYPSFQITPFEDVISQIRFWAAEFGVREFAFYDDALLMRSDIKRLLDALGELPYEIRFHTPNALHAKRITREISRLLREASFKTIRLGLETHLTGSQRPWDKKIGPREIEDAVESLFWAGFRPDEIGAYLLAGLPGQKPDMVYAAIEYTQKLGIPPYIAEYSPIPHTGLWEEAKRLSKYPLDEPLYHNNTIIPCWPGNERDIDELKRFALEVRESIRVQLTKDSFSTSKITLQ